MHTSMKSNMDSPSNSLAFTMSNSAAYELPNNSGARGVPSEPVPGPSEPVVETYAGFRARTNAQGKRQLQCPDCYAWIGLGESRGSLYTMDTHRKNNKCQVNQRKLAASANAGVVHGAPELTGHTVTGVPYPCVTHAPPPQIPSAPYYPQAPLNLPHQRASPHYPCTGIVLPWKPGQVAATYPWQLLIGEQSEMPYYISRGEKMGAEIWVKSKKCAQLVIQDGVACAACTDIPYERKHREAEERAVNGALPRTPYRYLSVEQLRGVLSRLQEDHNRLKLENLNLNRLVERLSALEQLISTAELDAPKANTTDESDDASTRSISELQSRGVTRKRRATDSTRVDDGKRSRPS